ncbi:hypothetical protein ACLI4Y_09310 [Natrialbaceae archaeon A-CW3]
MSLRNALRSLFDRIDRVLVFGGTVDHPSDGGITGEDYPGDDAPSEE